MFPCVCQSPVCVPMNLVPSLMSRQFPRLLLEKSPAWLSVILSNNALSTCLKFTPIIVPKRKKFYNIAHHPHFIQLKRSIFFPRLQLLILRFSVL